MEELYSEPFANFLITNGSVTKSGLQHKSEHILKLRMGFPSTCGLFLKYKLLTSVQENNTYGQKSITAFYDIWLISNDFDVTKTTCEHVGVKYQTDEYYGKWRTLFTGTEKCPKY